MSLAIIGVMWYAFATARKQGNPVLQVPFNAMATPCRRNFNVILTQVDELRASGSGRASSSPSLGGCSPHLDYVAMDPNPMLEDDARYDTR